jgi:hypothetical protein
LGAEKDNEEAGSNRRLEKIAQRGASRFAVLIKCCLGEQITHDKMGRTCGMYEEEKANSGFWKETKERATWKIKA